MRLTIKKKKIAEDALKKMAAIIAQAGGVDPLLTITAGENEVTLSAVEGAVMVSVTLAADVEKAGNAILTLSAMKEVLSTSGDALVIEKQGSHVSFSLGRTRIQKSVAVGRRVVEIPQKKRETPLKCDDFLRMLDGINLKTIEQNSLCVRTIHVEGSVLRGEASDNHRGVIAEATVSMDAEGKAPEGSTIQLAPKMFDALKSFLPKTPAYVGFDAEFVTISADGFYATLPQASAKPLRLKGQMEKVVASGKAFAVVDVEASEMLSSMKDLIKLSKGKDRCRLQVEGGKVWLANADETGDVAIQLASAKVDKSVSLVAFPSTSYSVDFLTCFSSAKRLRLTLRNILLVEAVDPPGLEKVYGVIPWMQPIK